MYCKDAQQMILPYIQRKLSDKELEKFIGHIKECSECYEELEIYFTIYFALERLDAGEQVSYDIQKLLLDDLKASSHQIHRRKLIHFYRNCFMGLAELVLLLILFTQIQMWGQGTSIQQTAVYEFIYGGAQKVESSWLKRQQIYETNKPEIEASEEIKSKEKKPLKKSGNVNTIPEIEMDKVVAPEQSEKEKSKTTSKTEKMKENKNTKNKSSKVIAATE